MVQVETYQTNGVGIADVTFTRETIDPEKAREYLSKNRDNRKLSPSWVRALALRQKRREWLFTRDPIRFDWDDFLRDGQHRLSMVIDTGTDRRDGHQGAGPQGIYGDGHRQEAGTRHRA